MKRSDRILSSVLLLGAAVTLAYWINYFVAGDVRVVPDLWYSAFEDALPVADGWMCLCLIGAGIGGDGDRGAHQRDLAGTGQHDSHNVLASRAGNDWRADAHRS